MFSFRKLFKPKRCHCCKRPFGEVEEVDRQDEIAAQKALLEGAFTCLKCEAVFHGKCGKIGRVTRKNAQVKCPRCGQMQNLELPFKFVVDGKDENKPHGDYFDKLEDQIS